MQPREWALSYAAKRLRVLPLHTVDSAGDCTCGRVDCSSPGKHPRIANGVKGATCEPEQIGTWWSSWPEANIGMALGSEAYNGGGLLALDIDMPDGPESLSILADEGKRLPRTLVQQTGGGGLHYLFRVPDAQPVRNIVGLRDGIDIRADNAYIVVAPSRHHSGNRYTWSKEKEPIATVPPWLLQEVRNGQEQRTSTPLPDQIPPGKRNDTLFRLGSKFRYGGLEETEILVALLAVHKARCKTPLDEAELAEIAASIVNRYPAGDSRGLWEQEEPDSWEDPLPLDTLPPVEPLDPDLLPSAIQPWIEDISARMQCPLEYPAAAAMVELGSVIGRQLGIRPKRVDDWLVVPNLWGCSIGPSGVLKSPPTEETLKPLQRLEVKAKEIFEEEMKDAAAREAYSEARKKELKKQIEKAVHGGRFADAELLSAQSIEQENEKPVRRRFIANDATVEKMGELLAANPHGILLHRDELTGWLRSLELENQQTARKFYLESWTGSGRYTVDRIGRGTIDIEAACVSIFGTIQPGPLQKYLRAALDCGVGDDGLLQRFQIVVWPDHSKTWVNVDRRPDIESRQRAFEVFEGLAELDLLKIQATTEGEMIPYLRFNPDAQTEFDDWRAGLEHKIRSGIFHPAFTAHLAQYRSLVPSLALIIHIASGGTGGVSLLAVGKAVAWAEFLEMHARRLYSPALNPALVAARELLRHLENADLPNPFTARTVYRNRWASLDREGTPPALDYLEENRWLKTKTVQTGGRPKIEFYIHPQLPRKQ